MLVNMTHHAQSFGNRIVQPNDSIRLGYSALAKFPTSVGAERLATLICSLIEAESPEGVIQMAPKQYVLKGARSHLPLFIEQAVINRVLKHFASKKSKSPQPVELEIYVKALGKHTSFIQPI